MIRPSTSGLLSAAVLTACSADGSQRLFGDEFPTGFEPLPGAAPPVPAHIAAALAPLAPGAQYVLCTNTLAVSVRYVQPPLPGRAARVEVVYSNLTAGAYHVSGIDDTYRPNGVRYFALRPDGSRELLRDEARKELTYAPRLVAGATVSRLLRMSPAVVNAVAGSEGVVVAYAMRMSSGWYLYAESTPLPVLPEPWEGDPPPLTQADWQAQLTNCVGQGVVPDPYEVLADFPDAAPYFPGVVLDAALPEAFRIEFAKRMPDVDGWYPGVLVAVTNAPDKDAPLVLAMLNVLRRSGGPSPEERAARRAVNQVVYAMSQDVENPLLFRMHAARLFPMRIPIEEFIFRTEAHFKLLAGDEIRGHRGGSYYEADRVQLRAGLTAMSTDTTPFVAGPLAGKYPENATVGQVAAIILADLEAKWAAEPPRQE
jgi:hypothetical protein